MHMVFKLNSPESIIDRFKEAHGNTYGYDKVIYKGVKHKVTITCTIHGDFEQLATNHIAGHGCPKCAGKNKSTEEVVAEFQEVHGDTYGYLEVKYISNNTKVKITCFEHGDFYQTPSNHRLGSGCPSCSKKNTAKTIIKKFEEVHQDEYDYSKVVFRKSLLGVVIGCKKHGDFKLSPKRHLDGEGCPYCQKNAKSITEIIADLAQIHANRYDYSQMNSVHAKSTLTLLCEEHGEFQIVLSKHLKGRGCPCCDAKPKKGAKFSKLSLDEVIAQFNTVHGNKYLYDLVNYQGTHKKVKIRCKEHGVFEQTPSNHKNGNGCPTCALNNESREQASKKRVLSNEKVIEQFKEAHGERYDYSDVTYEGNQVKVSIRCKEHGIFTQTPDHHKKGRGCPKCANLVRKEKSKKKPPRIYATVREHLIATGQLVEV